MLALSVAIGAAFAGWQAFSQRGHAGKSAAVAPAAVPVSAPPADAKVARVAIAAAAPVHEVPVPATTELVGPPPAPPLPVESAPAAPGAAEERGAPPKQADEKAAEAAPVVPIVAKDQPPTPAVTAPAAPTRPPQGKLDALALARHIDERIDESLRKPAVPASGLASDAEFIRRLWLDLHGVLPPAERVASFLKDQAADKRSQLIDEVLASPRYGQSMGDRWKDVLAAPRTTETDAVPVHLLAEWLGERFTRNQPWDAMTRDMLTATGTHEENAAVLLYLRNISNYTTGLRPHEPSEVANRLWPAFFGVDIRCAQCHDHKFAPVKQTDYWGMVAFLGKLKNDPAPGQKARALMEAGNRPVYPLAMVNELLAYNFDPRTIKPKFLYADQPKLAADASYRPTLATWATAPQNPYFARNFVNRTWSQLLGRGFAEPLTNFNEDQAPSNPELFKELAQQFTLSGFDVKHLIRAVCNSEAYQRTSRAVEKNQDDKVLFSHMAVKVMSAAQLYDSLTTLFDAPVYKPRNVGGQRTPDVRLAFTLFFEDGEHSPTAYQRQIPQTLRLMNSPEYLKGQEAFLGRLAPAGRAPDKVIDDLYLTLLARYPTAAERDLVKGHLKKGNDLRRGYGQVMWALLNCSEFSLIH